MWNIIERFIAKLDWYVHLIIGIVISFIIGLSYEWAIMALFIFSIILTYSIHFGLLKLLQFLINKKIDEDEEIPENIKDCIEMFREKYNM